CAGGLALLHRRLVRQLLLPGPLDLVQFTLRELLAVDGGLVAGGGLQGVVVVLDGLGPLLAIDGRLGLLHRGLVNRLLLLAVVELGQFGLRRLLAGDRRRVVGLLRQRVVVVLDGLGPLLRRRRVLGQLESGLVGGILLRVLVGLQQALGLGELFRRLGVFRLLDQGLSVGIDG